MQTTQAPLRSTVEIALEDGPAAGERRFRLSSRLELPAQLVFEHGLPVEGRCRGGVRFSLPAGPEIHCAAWLQHDPERPGSGSRAELMDASPEVRQSLQSYIEQRSKP